MSRLITLQFFGPSKLEVCKEKKNIQMQHFTAVKSIGVPDNYRNLTNRVVNLW